MSAYQNAEKRRQQILTAACDLAEHMNYREIRRHHLAEACQTAAGNISRVMGGMESFRNQLIDYAMKNERNTIVAQAIIDRHPAVECLSANARRKYLTAVQ